uniref:Cyclic nucleotide-binding domain-containing protein n=1 Tax=candidate division WOR-3 bacterium TaxID=2052148 RepID=A0A7C4YHL4_UNCW3
MIRERIFKKGEFIFKEGESSYEMYLILKGRVKITKNNVVLNELKSGDFVGEMGVLDRRPRSATAEAIEDTVVQVLDSETLRKKMEEDPLIGALILTLVKRLRETDRRLVGG